MMLWKSQMDKLTNDEKSVGNPPPTGSVGFLDLDL